MFICFKSLKKIIKKIFVIKVLFIIFLFACHFLSFAETIPIKNTKLVLMWKPQAQFAGYYAAYEKGFYKKYGLDVEIIEGGPDVSPGELLKNENADFAVMWLSSAINFRSQGYPFVNIAQIVQRSALMLIAKQSSGITKPEEFKDKKVNLWEGELRVQPEAFFKKYQIDVSVIPQAYTVNLFLNDGVDAVSAMWYNEYHTILNSGIDPEELNIFFYSDYGLNFPEDGLYAREETVKKDQKLVTNFVKATVEGWQYCFDNTQEAVDIVLKYMRQSNVPANVTHQKWMLNRMKDIILQNNKLSVILKKEDYQFVSNELLKSSIIKNVPDFNGFFFKVNIDDKK